MPELLNSNVSYQWTHFIRTISLRAGTIRVFMVTTVIVVILGTWLQTPIYRATASVLIDMETPSVLAVSTSKDESTVAQTSYLTYADYYRTQLEVLASRAIAEKVLRNLRLDQEPYYRRSKDPVSVLLAQVKIEPVKQTRLAKIYVEDRRPEQAARIANEFAFAFVLENLDKTSAAESMLLMKNGYLKLQAKQLELSKRYKAQHPAMIRIQKEMEQLIHTMEGASKQQLHPAGPSVGSDSSSHAPVSPEERLKESESASMVNLRPNNIRVQDLAQPPLKPAKPRKLLNLLLGLILGSVGGVGAAMIQELLDNSLKSPEELEEDSHLVLLGHIPAMDVLQGTIGTQMQQSTQFAHVEPFSAAAEAYRAIRTRLMYAAPMGKAKAIVFTSAGPEEGKTTTISNLSVAIAQNGVKTLLVDADLRKGRLHEVFQKKRSPGLSEFLTGQVSLKEILRESGVQGLSLVTCGFFPPYPAELLGSPQMQQFIEEVTARYDRVLIDAPPILAVTDPVVIASLVKTVIVVAQSGKTPRQALYRLLKICNDIQAKMLGVILNKVAVASVAPYYRYSSYYSSRQSDDSDFGTPLPRPSSRPV